MKIVVISPAHPLRGGIAASSERLALALQEKGHEVVIYSFSLQYPAFLFPGKTQFTTDEAPENLQIKTVINAINPLNWFQAGRKMAKENPDRVVVRYWLPFMGACLGTILRELRFLSKKQVVITALTDNIIPHESRIGDRFLSRYFTGACHEFVVMSQSVGAEIRTFTKDKPIRFAAHPVYDIYGKPMPKQAARIALGLPANAQIVLFFGFIRAYKGLDWLLESMVYMPEIHLIIAGECYEDWAGYDAIIKSNNITDRVHLALDFIPSDAVTTYFSAADLVVQPYKTATQSGISQVAYHFEKPMVVTDVGGLAEIVTDGISGYVVAPEPKAISAAILDFFQNNREYAMISGVKQEKKRFSWDNLTDAILGQSPIVESKK